MTKGNRVDYDIGKEGQTIVVDHQGNAKGIKDQFAKSDPNAMLDTVTKLESMYVFASQTMVPEIAHIETALQACWEGDEADNAVGIIAELKTNADEMAKNSKSVHRELDTFHKQWAQLKNQASGVDGGNGTVHVLTLGAAGDADDAGARKIYTAWTKSANDAMVNMPNSLYYYEPMDGSGQNQKDGQDPHAPINGPVGSPGGVPHLPSGGPGPGPSSGIGPHGPDLTIGPHHPGSGISGPGTSGPGPEPGPGPYPGPYPGPDSSGGPGGVIGGGGGGGYPGTHVPGGVGIDDGSSLAGYDGGGAGGGLGLGGGGLGAGGGGLGAGGGGLGAGGGGLGAGGGGLGAGGGGLGAGGGLAGGDGSGLAGGAGAGAGGAGAFGGGAGGGTAGGAGAGTGGRGMMMPMHGANQGDDGERERSTWLDEDEDVWGTDEAPPGVIS